ncbi:hypothetical protein BPNPMPFG_002477 [Mesorhizobium sp. AR07]|uniref:hypothetical protein n=1 Tax=Mesorhizobium sp. AR07 TaxID=2865838 RepID=UPI002160854B|nr:hypothetical protein [Mesorhizobium sp. AR07]UVK46769.1 hypothetical protein BPNPMPFG_002477 [Mesorhizobium sp. AR07]
MDGNVMAVLRNEFAGQVSGVNGRFHNVISWDSGMIANQIFGTEARPIKDYGKGATIRAELRFDDNCKNGHATFAITAEIRDPAVIRDRGIVACGCLHDDIAKAFPELAPLIRWHLVSTDGPMHYIANTVYMAGDRDHYGLRAGEKRPLINGRTKRPMWELVAINSLGVAISTTPTGLEYQGAEIVPLYILEKSWDGENAPATPLLKWQRQMRTGEGKARDLDAARNAAVWPDATDDELSAEPEALKAALAARLPALQADFKAAMVEAGFLWLEGWIRR